MVFRPISRNPAFSPAYNAAYLPTALVVNPVPPPQVFTFTSAMPSGFTYTRADTVATYRDSNGKLQKAASNTPRFDYDINGNSLGLRIEGQIQNKCTNSNAVPAATTNVTKGGDAASSLSVAADATAIAAAKLDAVVTGNVFKLDNSAGSTAATATVSGATGDTNAHSLSVWARITTGTGILGFASGAGAVNFTGATYQRVKSANVTPGSSSETLMITAPAGAIVFFILNQLEELPIASSVIVTAGAAATRQQDICYYDNINGLSWWDEPAGAMTARYALAGDILTTQYIACATDGTNHNEAIGIRTDTTGFDLKPDISHLGTIISGVGTGTAHSANIPTFAGITWKNGNAIILGQGVNEVMTYSGAASGTTRLNIGARNTGSQRMFGWISELKLASGYQTPATLAALAQRTGDTVILAGGQSLADGYFFSQGTNLDTGRQQFITTLNGARVADAVTMVDGATGGTAACRTTVDPGTNYWWDNINNVPGPTLLNFYTVWAANGVKPNIILWAQGEQDSSKINVLTTQAQYKAAVVNIFNHMRATIGPLPILIQRIGRRQSFVNPPGVQAIREVQEQLAAENSFVTLGAETYDLPQYSDGEHLSSAGYGTAALRGSRKILNYIYGGSLPGVNGPVLVAATRNTTTVTATIIHDAGTDFTPTSGIKGFHFFDNTSEITVTAAVRTNATTITLTLNSTPTSGIETLYYDYDAEDGTDATKFLIDNATIPMPLLSGKISLSPPTFTMGVNIVDLYGNPNVLPGSVGTDFWQPLASDFAYASTSGFTFVRLAFLWERLQPTLNAALDPTYLSYIDTAITMAAAHGLGVSLDCHNYGRYRSNVFGDGVLTGAQLADLWGRIDAVYGTDARVIDYDIQNEPHDFTGAGATWLTVAQTMVTNLRAAGSTKKLKINGYGYSSTYQWVGNNPNLHTLSDPLNNIEFSGHLYFDSNDEGLDTQTWAQAVAAGDQLDSGNTLDTNIGTKRVSPWIAWGRTHGLKLSVGENGWAEDDNNWNVTGDKLLALLQASGINYTYYAGSQQEFGESYNFYYGPPTTNSNIDLKQTPVLRKYTGATMPTAYFLSFPHENYTPPSTASASFTYFYRGLLGSNVVVMPSDGGAGGTFTPTTITFAAGTFNPSGSFTYTPSATPGVFTISTTNNGSLTDPSSFKIRSNGYDYGSISNIIALWDANDASKFSTSSASNVWTDSINGYTAVASASQANGVGKATYGTDARGGYVLFNGSQGFGNVNLPTSVASGAFTIIALTENSNSGSSPQEVLVGYAGASQSWGLEVGFFGTNFTKAYSGDNASKSNRSANLNVPIIDVVRRNGTTLEAITADGNETSISTASNATINKGFSMGMYITGATGFNLYGKIRKLLICNGALTDSQLDTIAAALIAEVPNVDGWVNRAASSSIQMEDGTYILQEDGSKISTE